MSEFCSLIFDLQPIILLISAMEVEVRRTVQPQFGGGGGGGGESLANTSNYSRNRSLRCGFRLLLSVFLNRTVATLVLVPDVTLIFDLSGAFSAAAVPPAAEFPPTSPFAANAGKRGVFLHE